MTRGRVRMQGGEWSDDELMQAIRDALDDTADVSERRRTAAQAALTWRTVDAELLELLHDSALEEGAAVRATGSSRQLSFGGDNLSVEVEVADGGVLGQVLPAQRARVTLVRPDAGDVVADTSVDTDAAGFFRFTEVSPGTLRLVVTIDDGSVSTAWLTI